MDEKKKNATGKDDSSGSLPPLKVFVSDDVSASVFAREHTIRDEKRTFYSYALSRSYRDAKGVYRYTKSFNPGDRAKIDIVFQQAEDFIRQQQK